MAYLKIFIFLPPKRINDYFNLSMYRVSIIRILPQAADPVSQIRKDLSLKLSMSSCWQNCPLDPGSESTPLCKHLWEGEYHDRKWRESHAGDQPLRRKPLSNPTYKKQSALFMTSASLLAYSLKAVHPPRFRIQISSSCEDP